MVTYTRLKSSVNKGRDISIRTPDSFCYIRISGKYRLTTSPLIGEMRPLGGIRKSRRYRNRALTDRDDGKTEKEKNELHFHLDEDT